MLAGLGQGKPAMSIKPNKPACSIVIPAYNEETCIRSTLLALTRGMMPGEFEIIVICNGCQDNTAVAARDTCEVARVIETSVTSKTNALNIGIKETNSQTVVFLDADIKTTTKSVRLLVQSLEATESYLAFGKAQFNSQECTAAVRAFYNAWRLNPYFDGGKVGGFFAVSRMGLKKLGTFPNLTNDDEYVRRTLMEKAVMVPAAKYIVEPPRTLSSLTKVRSRVYRGNRELASLNVPTASNQQQLGGYRFLTRLLRNPRVWAGALVFAAVAVAAHVRNRLLRETNRWEQDTTARTTEG